jgi:hypothetical protein
MIVQSAYTSRDTVDSQLLLKNKTVTSLIIIPQHHHLAKARTTPRRDEPQKPSENSITLAPHSTGNSTGGNPFFAEKG